jgi:putative membrane protein
MGAADVVPGVSGGTMAFILGIYEELIDSIRSFDLDFFRLLLSLRPRDALDHVSWQFLLAVGTGILTAVFTFARVLSWLLQNRPVLIWSFFFGLIVASVFTVSRYIKTWSPSIFIWIGLGTISAYFLVGMIPISTPDTPWFLFMSGAIAICAMILPGISGAFVLVLLGKYSYVLRAVNQHDFFTLFLVATGAIAGLMSFVRLLKWLFDRHHDLTVAILTGLMLGSLRKVWPWKKTLQTITGPHGHSIVTAQTNILPHCWDKEVTTGLCLATLGLLIVLSLDFWAYKKK